MVAITVVFIIADVVVVVAAAAVATGATDCVVADVNVNM